MISTDRYLHCLGVGRKMEKFISDSFPQHTRLSQEMFLLGLLHDIGYEHYSNKDHAKSGGKLLESSDYKYWKEVYYHGDVTKDYDSFPLTLLNFADLTVNSKGEEVTIDNRLEEICNKYGESSVEYLNCCMVANGIEDKLYKMCASVLEPNYFGEGIFVEIKGSDLILRGKGIIKEKELLSKTEILKYFSTIKISEEVSTSFIYPRFSFLNLK